jgi:hypothetical protein
LPTIGFVEDIIGTPCEDIFTLPNDIACKILCCRITSFNESDVSACADGVNDDDDDDDDDCDDNDNDDNDDDDDEYAKCDCD